MARRKLRSSGELEKRGPNSIRARYIGADGIRYSRTFKASPGETLADVKDAASLWLAQELNAKRAATPSTWISPQDREQARARAKEAAQAKNVTLREYSRRWLSLRALKPRTHADYTAMLDRLILPRLGGYPLAEITRHMIEQWHDDIGVSDLTGKPVPRQQSQAYALLRAIMNSAVKDELIERTPCMIEGGASPARKRGVSVLTAAEATLLADSMPEKRYRLAVLLGAWCAMREGEILALRRSDFHLDKTNPERSTITIRRGVVRVAGEFIEGNPKTESSVRILSIPPAILPEITAHLETYAQWGRDGLLFPNRSGSFTHVRVLGQSWHQARTIAGRQEFHFHDLRGTGATWLIENGASVPDVMRWLGHTTVTAAMRYWQASTRARQITLAASLPALEPSDTIKATGQVIQLQARSIA